MRLSAGTASATALSLGVALLIPSVAPAFEEAADDQARQPRARQIIASLEQTAYEKSWLTSHFKLSTKKGVVYRDAFPIGNQKLLLKLWGPIVKKRPGLGFKIEGLKIGDNPIVLKGYGNTKKGKLTFKVSF